MSDIHTSIEIDAPAETVWSVLTDFAAYPEWNPYTRIEGTPRPGERLRVSPGPEAGRAPTFRPRVLVGILMRFVREPTEANFHGVNEALKARTESLADDAHATV